LVLKRDDQINANPSPIMVAGGDLESDFAAGQAACRLL
jgi:hypothetical protein